MLLDNKETLQVKRNNIYIYILDCTSDTELAWIMQKKAFLHVEQEVLWIC